MRQTGIKLCVSLLGCVTMATADTIMWTGAEDNQWGNTNNWDGLKLPGTGDYAVFDTATSEDAPARLENHSVTNISQIRIGNAADSSGHLIIANAAVTNSSTLYVGNAGYGNLFVTNSTINNPLAGTALILGNTVSGTGVMHVAEGAIVTAPYKNSFVVGEAGSGRLVIDSGYVSCQYDITVGSGLNSSGFVSISNGTLRSRSIKVGGSGTGYMEWLTSDGVFAPGDNIYIGNNSTGVGTVVLGAGTVSLSRPSSLRVGVAGKGTLLIRGTTLDIGGANNNSNTQIFIRNEESATGLVQGWGLLREAREFHNNGYVVADGQGENRDLTVRLVSAASHPWRLTNTIDNVSDHGWYAVNKGRLTLMPRSVTAAMITDGAYSYSWGETEQDEDIDLVNSLRFSFSGVSAGSLTASLLAPDRTLRNETDPMPPLPENVVGLWDISYSANFTSTDIEFRYDKASVPRGHNTLRLARWDDVAEKWIKLDTYETGTPDAPYRVKTNALLPQGNAAPRIGLIGLFAQPDATLLILR